MSTDACSEKVAPFTRDRYCEKHGRAAGWPCKEGGPVSTEKLTPEERRALQWTAAWLQERPEQPRCRCAGTCTRCREWAVAREKIGPETVLRLCAALEAAEEQMRLARFVVENDRGVRIVDVLKRAEAAESRLQAAQKAWAAIRFTHASTCLGFIPAQRTPPDWSFAECSCGFSALATALEGPTKEAP